MPFKEGQSGNPLGAAIGTRKKKKQIRFLLMHLSAPAIKALEEMLKDPDTRAFATKEILDRVWGKAVSPMELTGKDGSKLTIIVKESE